MQTFKRNLFIGYGISLLLLIITAVASAISINNLLRNQEQVRQTSNVIIKLENVMAVLKDAETGQRGFLLTGKDQFLEPYNGSTERAKQTLNEIQDMTAASLPQQKDLVQLKTIVFTRLDILANLITQRRSGIPLSDSALFLGKSYMDQARDLVGTMQEREQAQLEERTASLNRVASYTPVLILIASLLSLLVTVISFIRVLSDFNRRAELQSELEQKNNEISERIRIVDDVTGKIASGEFSTRVDEAHKANLGSLAVSLDKMAESLETSFASLAEREWHQAGIAGLNELMIGEKDEQVLLQKILPYLASYTNSSVGAFYTVKNADTLNLSAALNIDLSKVKKNLSFGESVAGSCAQSEKVIVIQPANELTLTIDYSGGSLHPTSIIAVPVKYETIIKGVLELGSIEEVTPAREEFLRTAGISIGQAIHSARDHSRLQELLAETQAQSEELQSQHSELENVNAELSAQAEKLQASEEELRVQQEELQQANQELEERSRLLEEKNEMILERNLDIQRKAEELELSTKYKSEFLANMSHELRTPLNSILLLSRLLSENHDNNLNNDQVEYANVIQTSGKGLLTLIDEILDLSKIESGKMELDVKSVLVNEVAEDLGVLFQPIAKDKGIVFKVNIQESMPSEIETDRLRLDQILRNLISNALKFTRHGSVELNLKAVKDELHFAVKDTGIGIPEEKQQTIFEAFQQADGSTRRFYGGTGLGLSISRELARLLRGEIRLTSEVNKGSEFTLVIPKKFMQGEEIEEAVSAGTEKEIAPEVKSSKPQKESNPYISEVIPAAVPDDRDNISSGDKTILIIEDDTAFAKSLLHYTRQKGYKGVIAVRGDEGIELASRILPTGILLDVQLPIKSGWEVMDELKKNKETRAIPVHMMSSHEVKTKSISKGAVDFISKPFAFEQMGDMIKKIETALSKEPKKVLIVEENTKHAEALAYFLQSFNVASDISKDVEHGISALKDQGVDCVILDMGIPTHHSYEMLEKVKKTPGFENLPIIIFTGKNLSHVEEVKIRQYADSIVVKTAQSYQRILDEVSLFLHLVEENKKDTKPARYKRMGELSEVLNNKNILIADDDVRNIFSLTKSLENYGINVYSAVDGKDALKQLAEHPDIHLVLMDMMMPEMDGYESTRQIRNIPKYKNLPVIAVTAKAMTGDREKCIAAGASDYITKPVDTDQLISLLRVWLYS